MPPLTEKKSYKPLLTMLLSSALLLAPQAFSAPTSQPPQAYGDYAVTTSGQKIVINALKNDAGKGLFIRKVNNTANGSTSIVHNKIVYRANTNFVGHSTFWYQIKDSLGRLTSNKIVVRVNKPTINSARPIANNDRAKTKRGKTITIAPLWNDTGTQIRITKVDTTTTQGSKVKIVSANRVQYTPSKWAKAGDTFWYAVTDKFGRKSAAKVVVAVTTASTGVYPKARSDYYTVNKNSKGTRFKVLSNDTGTGLSFAKVYAYSKKGGRTYNNGSSITYNAPKGFIGTDQFWYSMKDLMGRTNSAKVTITVKNTQEIELVTDPNFDDRINAVADSINSNTNAGEFEIFVLANDTDPNNAELIVDRIVQARFGSVRLVDGRVLYTPPSYPTVDSFIYVAGSAGGAVETNLTLRSAVVTVNVR